MNKDKQKFSFQVSPKNEASGNSASIQKPQKYRKKRLQKIHNQSQLAKLYKNMGKIKTSPKQQHQNSQATRIQLKTKLKKQIGTSRIKIILAPQNTQKPPKTKQSSCWCPQTEDLDPINLIRSYFKCQLVITTLSLIIFLSILVFAIITQHEEVIPLSLIINTILLTTTASNLSAYLAARSNKFQKSCYTFSLVLSFISKLALLVFFVMVMVGLGLLTIPHLIAGLFSSNHMIVLFALIYLIVIAFCLILMFYSIWQMVVGCKVRRAIRQLADRRN